MDGNGIFIFAGNSSLALAQRICDYLKIPLGGAKVTTFSDGEIQIEILENVRSKDVFVVQSTCAPVNDSLVELLLMIDAFKRSSARRITAVLPYYGYSRQDKKVAPRVPISAKLVADMITVAGAHRVITMDLHAGQIQGFFNIPVDNLFAAPVLIRHIREHFDGNLAIVSPDAGGVERARAFAKRLDADLAIIDDMVDTAGTLVEAAEALAREGAREVHACCAHAVLSGPAVGRICDSVLKSVVVTDTIPLKPNAQDCGKIRVLSIADLVGEAIIRSYRGDSVTSLFV
jgi:ribose-phosphate pyrophosphokinase